MIDEVLSPHQMFFLLVSSVYSNNGIWGKSICEDKEPVARLPFLYAVQCVMDFSSYVHHFQVSLRTIATAQNWYGQNHTGRTAVLPS